jgi:hypothetical protein
MEVNPQDTINAQEYGFLPTNSGTDNRIAWGKALDAAQAEGKALHIPSATYKLELTSDESTGATLTSSITIFGDALEESIIDVYPKVVRFPFRVIAWDKGNLHVTIKHLKVLGPTGTDAPYPDLMPDCGFLRGLVAAAQGDDNRLTIDHLVVTGKFLSVIHVANGDGLVEIRNSDISALSICVSVFETTNSYLNKRFHAHNCSFTSGVPAAQTSPDTGPFGICVYLHPHVAARVTNCRFYDNPRDAIKQFGIRAVGNAPLYSEFIGCQFFNCTWFTIITPGENVVTLIEGCLFDAGQLGCRNHTNVIGCEFRNSAGIKTTVGSQEQFEVNVEGCRATVVKSSDEEWYAPFADSANMSLVVHDCDFLFDEGSKAAVQLAHAPYGEVSHCRFIAKPNPNNVAQAVLLGSQEGTKCRLSDCVFTGSFGLAAVSVQPGAKTGSIEINRCNFWGVAGAPIHFDTEKIEFGDLIYGRDNLFNDRRMITGGEAHNMIARLRPRQAIALETVTGQKDVSDSGDSGSPKWTILLDRSYNTFHVSGPQIDYVYMGISHVERNKFAGPVHLIADNRWLLTSKGNIRPRHPKWRSIDEVVTLFHDPVTETWHEQ